MGLIPPEARREARLFVFATAGIRLLPRSQGDAILEAIRTELPRRFPFRRVGPLRLYPAQRHN